MPATAEPSDAYSSVFGLPPARYMKYASVALTIGQVAPTPIANGDRDMILKWISQPIASTRSVVTRRLSLGGHERDVGVLERRLARGDAAHRRVAELGEERLRQ